MRPLELLTDRLLRVIGLGAGQRHRRLVKRALAVQEDQRLSEISRLLTEIRHGRDMENGVNLLFWLLVIGESKTDDDGLHLMSNFRHAIEMQEYRNEWHPLLLSIVCMSDGTRRNSLVYDLAKVMDRLVQDADVYRLFHELHVDKDFSNFDIDYYLDQATAAIAG